MALTNSQSKTVKTMCANASQITCDSPCDSVILRKITTWADYFASVGSNMVASTCLYS